MDEKTLMKEFRKITVQTGFVPKKREKPWMPQLGPGQYRAVVSSGAYVGMKAVLKVSPYEHYDEIAKDFKSYHFGVSSTYAVMTQRVLDKGSIGRTAFIIQENPEGERMLPNYPRSTMELKRQVAMTYWATRRAFRLASNLLVNANRDDGTDYLVRRYSQYTKTRMETKPSDVCIDRSLENKAFSFIFDHAGDIRVQPSFSHFCNTDIVKSGNQLYIVDAAIVSRPEMYEAAFWLWGATMYAYDIAPKIWIRELERWIDVFIKESPHINPDSQRLKLEVCLVERMLGTLMVDLPLRRSPFDKLPKAAAIMEANLARSVIEHICAKFP